jgi:hypothetical protein
LKSLLSFLSLRDVSSKDIEAVWLPIRTEPGQILHLGITKRAVWLWREGLKPNTLAPERGVDLRLTSGISLRPQHLGDGSAENGFPWDAKPLFVGSVDELIPPVSTDEGGEYRECVG